jgi:tRNA threonylcarbamoyl adenosine modification protein YeaZ
VLLLALDTATPAVTVALHDGSAVVAEAGATDARRHAELLAPLVEQVLEQAGATAADLTDVAVGTGPGPFTGLRVGLVTARMTASALGLGLHGVSTLDVLAAQALEDGTLGRQTPAEFLVATDARRREVYWAAYDQAARRVHGPHVLAPAALRERLVELDVSVAAGGSADVTGLPVTDPAAPSPAGLVAVAAAALRRGAAPGPLEPLYLRRPDAVEPGPRKPVSTG